MNKKSILSFILLFAIVCFVAAASCRIKALKEMHTNTTLTQPVRKTKVGPMSRTERKIISDLITKTIQDGLNGKEKSYPNLKDYPKKWSEPKVVYTTLYIGDKLRGCQGNLNHKKPLLYAIVDSAYDAAFRDSRFRKLTQREFNHPDFYFYISVFGEKTPLKFKNEKDIIRQLKPFQYGVILKYTQDNGKKKRGLFLPSVWKKYPDPRMFWKRLKRKAKINEGFYSDKFEVEFFDAETIRDLNFIVRQDAERIQKAVFGFKNLFNPNGHILYEWNYRNGRTSTKNNIVREMGTGYGLAYAYYMLHDETMQPHLQNFLRYAQSIAVPYNNGKLIADKQNPHKIKVPAGASALALLAVLYYEQESHDLYFKQFRTDLKNALVSLYEPGVGVHSSPTDKKTSPYYDGETWLALTMYNIFYPEDKDVAGLMSDMNRTMFDKYHNKYLPNFFHWGTQAAAQQYAHTQDALMYDFLKKQLNIYIDTVDIRLKFTSCSYAEGLAEAALALKDKDEALYKKTLERLENQQDIARILQDIPLKKYKRGEIHPNMNILLGLFLGDADNMTTRNDVTQHCLSALLKSQQVFKEVQ